MKDKAFTLAEMMIVMLILTICLAAITPLITKRKPTTSADTPWRWSANNSDAYYGLSTSQTAMIGQNAKSSSDPSSRLIINKASDSQIPLLFKKGENIQGQLQVGKSNFFFNAQNSSAMTGTNNTAIGYNTLRNNISGGNNTAIGCGACQNVTGSNKTCIGYNSGPDSTSAYASDDSKLVYLGDSETNVIIPGNLLVMGGLFFHGERDNYDSSARTFDIATILMDFEGTLHNLYLGHCPLWYKECQEGGINLPQKVLPPYFTSDRRLKNVGQEFTDGIEKLRLLPLYNYTFKDDKRKTPQVGIMAQDLRKVFPNSVTKDNNGYLVIRQDEMFYALINSVKQLDKLMQGFINELKIIENKLDILIKQEKDKDQKIKELEKRLKRLELKD